MTKYVKNSIPLEGLIEFSSLAGKKVLSKEGEKLGDIEDILIDPVTFAVGGVKTKRGMTSFPRYFGGDYIKSIGKEGIILDIVPVDRHIGKKVFSPEGTLIGKVRDVKRGMPTNKLFSIIIDAENHTGDIIVEKNQIESIAENIILK